MNIKSDASLSISKDSVFDWGSQNGGGGDKPRKNGNRRISLESDFDASTLTTAVDMTGAGKKIGGPPSRYDPETMNRIPDIHNLVDDSSDDESEFDVKAATISGSDRDEYVDLGSSLRCRRASIIFALIGIIAAASLAIGYTVNKNNNIHSHSNSPLKSTKDPYTVAVSGLEEQQLLELAERVITACSESKLYEDGGSECQELCGSKLCCFESGEDSCEDDEIIDCAVYVGCEAIVEGILTEAAEEDEE